MSRSELALLDALTLVPLNDSCTVDGYSLSELTVVDSDGTVARYRDTGCSYLVVEGAKTLLPPDFDASAFMDGSTTCGG